MAGEAKVSSFNCENCGAPIEVRAAGFTVSVACPNCQSVSAKEMGLFKLVEKSEKKAGAVKPIIPLGSKGKFGEHVFQVIGFMQRYDVSWPDQAWREYLLYNPYQGYRWLNESNSHWTLFKALQRTPKMKFNDAELAGETFKRFHLGKARVGFVLGEFYWRVSVGDEVRTFDAILPPRVLSREQDGSETVWSIGEYVAPSVVKAAFKLSDMPSRWGVSPPQPNPYPALNNIWTTWFLALVALFFIQIVGGMIRSGASINGETMAVPPSGVTDVEVAKFETFSRSSAAEINFRSDVSQTWATVAARVVAEDPDWNEEREFEAELSHYSGYTDGESWSEGERTAEFLATDLPKGKYRVLVTASPESGHTATIYPSVRLAPNVWSNLWLCLFLISLPPIFISMRSHGFEKERWSESDFNPYASSEDS